jgi:hypothetical protein
VLCRDAHTRRSHWLKALHSILRILV